MQLSLSLTVVIGFLCDYREDHPDLVESMAKKGSNVPEKPRTPQQLWYSHEKKAFLKTHADVSYAFQDRLLAPTKTQCSHSMLTC